MPNALKDRLNWTAFRDRTLVPAGVRLRDWRDNDPFIAAVRRPGAPEKIAASITVLLLLAIVIFLMLFDWNWLRGPIGRWASANLA